MGYEIDCVNLRAETYTGMMQNSLSLMTRRLCNSAFVSFCPDSRIPVIRNGTAHEDALRR